MRLNPQDFYKWAADKWIEYAAETVRHSGKRLKMLTNVHGDFKVVYGEETVYSGCSAINAVEIYNNHTS